MSRHAKFILGLGVAMITAATLHFTVGDRYYQMSKRYRAGFGPGYCHPACGKQPQSASEKMQENPKN